MNIKKLAAILLAIIAVAMIIIGYRGQMLPPALTGFGFVLIAWVWLRTS